jgi:hypothetical protein
MKYPNILYTALLSTFLTVPFALAFPAPVLEPYPAVLLPAGAGTIKTAEDQTDFERSSICGRLVGRDAWTRLSPPKFLSPIPAEFFPPLVQRYFGLSPAGPIANRTRVGIVITIDTRRVGEEEVKNAKQWLRARLHGSAGRAPWRAWLLVATCFHLANALLLNIPFYSQIHVYLPFVAFARSFGRLNVRVRATNTVFLWAVPVIFCAIILGVAHTAQRLKGGGSPFLFVEGDSVVSISMYVSLALLALGAGIIAMDLITCVYDTRLHRDSSRRGVPDDARSGPDMADRSAQPER